MKVNPCYIGVLILVIVLLIMVVTKSVQNSGSGNNNGNNNVETFGSGYAMGSHGSHTGDAWSEEELYLTQYDHMLEGIDPEIQSSQNEYVKEQDQYIVSRGAAGPHATETDHYTPPNKAWGLTGFRQFWHDTYTLPDARQMPSDDPDQYYSSNPTGYVIGAPL